jgi:uncharacterized membrane protein
MTKSKTNTIVSYAFRSAVAAHFASLFVLFFVLKNTLGGAQHYTVAVVLTILMAMIAVLFVADMAMRTDAGRGHAKLVDGVIGLVWLAVVVVLSVNSIRAGM